MYDNLSRSDLVWKINELKRQVKELEEQLKERESEINSLQFKIDSELKPRIRAENNRYDNWATNPERF